MVDVEHCHPATTDRATASRMAWWMMRYCLKERRGRPGRVRTEATAPDRDHQTRNRIDRRADVHARWVAHDVRRSGDVLRFPVFAAPRRSARSMVGTTRTTRRTREVGSSLNQKLTRAGSGCGLLSSTLPRPSWPKVLAPVWKGGRSLPGCLPVVSFCRSPCSVVINLCRPLGSVGCVASLGGV